MSFLSCLCDDVLDKCDICSHRLSVSPNSSFGDEYNDTTDHFADYSSLDCDSGAKFCLDDADNHNGDTNTLNLNISDYRNLTNGMDSTNNNTSNGSVYLGTIDSMNKWGSIHDGTNNYSNIWSYSDINTMNDQGSLNPSHVRDYCTNGMNTPNTYDLAYGEVGDYGGTSTSYNNTNDTTISNTTSGYDNMCSYHDNTDNNRDVNIPVVNGYNNTLTNDLIWENTSGHCGANTDDTDTDKIKHKQQKQFIQNTRGTTRVVQKYDTMDRETRLHGIDGTTWDQFNTYLQRPLDRNVSNMIDSSNDLQHSSSHVSNVKSCVKPQKKKPKRHNIKTTRVDDVMARCIFFVGCYPYSSLEKDYVMFDPAFILTQTDKKKRKIEYKTFLEAMAEYDTETHSSGVTEKGYIFIHKNSFIAMFTAKIAELQPNFKTICIFPSDENTDCMFPFPFIRKTVVLESLDFLKTLSRSLAYTNEMGIESISNLCGACTTTCDVQLLPLASWRIDTSYSINSKHMTLDQYAKIMSATPYYITSSKWR